MYVVGFNVEVFWCVGIYVDCYLIKVYVLLGMLAGLAGFFSFVCFVIIMFGGYDIDNFNVIVVVVFGGMLLFGGIGTIGGIVVGVFIFVVLQNGFVIIGVQFFW